MRKINGVDVPHRTQVAKSFSAWPDKDPLRCTCKLSAQGHEVLTRNLGRFKSYDVLGFSVRQQGECFGATRV